MRFEHAKRAGELRTGANSSDLARYLTRVYQRIEAVPPDVLNGAKIFLIENHDGLRSLVASFLEAQGAKVFPYSVATDVITDLTHECPDLILPDLSGAEASGFRLVEQIRRLRRRPE